MADITVTAPGGAPTSTLAKGYHAFEIQRELISNEQVIIRPTTGTRFHFFAEPKSPNGPCMPDKIDQMRVAVFVNGDTDTVFEGVDLKTDVTIKVTPLD